MKVRYSYLKQQFSNAPDLWKKLKDFVETGDFTLGKPLQEFEKKFAKLIGTKYAVGVNSGTDAIKLPLKAIGIKPGDEIITTPFSFISTAETISLLKAKPVFVDIEPDTFNIDASKIESAISPQTIAIMPVSIFGQPADINYIDLLVAKINELENRIKELEKNK